MTKQRVCACGAKHYARGYCARCYAAARKRGEFQVAKCASRHCHESVSGSSDFCRVCGNSPDQFGLPVRFWHYVQVADDVPTDDPCWIWTGTRSEDGWPQWSIGDVMTSSHHSTFMAVTGEAPPSDTLWRSCGNVACLNPTHAVPVTRRWAVLQGRRSPISGFRGVERSGANGWRARARSADGSSVSLGIYGTQAEAHQAYRAYVKQVDPSAVGVA